MRTIISTNKKNILVSDGDYDFLSQWHWNVNDRGYVAMTSGPKGFRKPQTKMHYFLLTSIKGLHVDHINGNPLDNQRLNLRQCTPQQNMSNQKLRITNRSGYKGVFRDGNKWLATIQFNKRSTRIGLFKYRKNAAKAYNKMAMRLFGEFANLNIISKDV